MSALLSDLDVLERLREFCARDGFASDCSRPKRGEMIALRDFSPGELLPRLLACWEAGAIPVLAPNSASLESWGALVPAPEEGALLFGAFSSGTTSKKNLHFFRLGPAAWNAVQHAESFGLSAGDVIVQSLSLQHVFGIIAYVFAPAVSGARVQWAAAPADWTYRIPESSGRHVLHLVPDQTAAFDRSAWAGRAAVVSVGAASCGKAWLDRVSQTPAELFVTYGLTEAGPRVSTGRWSAENPEGWTGQPFPAIGWKLHGTLKIRTPSSSIGTPLDEQGFLDTGDLFEPHSTGLLFRGRADGGFKFRGRLLFPRDFLAAKAVQGIYEPAIFLFEPDPSRWRLLIPSAGAAEPWRRVFSAMHLPVPEFVVEPLPAANALAKLDLGDLRLRSGPGVSVVAL